MYGLALLSCCLAAGPELAGGSIRDGFESAQTAWVRAGGDVQAVVRDHSRTGQTAHSGTRCEHIAVTAGRGGYLYYAYPIGRALVEESLSISVWVKSDNPGVQLLARVVFPRERDPETLRLLDTLITGDTYRTPGSWARLEIARPELALERQVRLLRARLQRDVDTREAYVDRVVLNIYGGPGQTEVFIDDLEVSPVVQVRQAGLPVSLAPPRPSSGVPIEVSQEQLLVAGEPRFVRLVRAPGVPPKSLKEFGFSAAVVEWPLDVQRIEQTITAGLWLHPIVPLSRLPEQSGAGELDHMLSEFPLREAILFWGLGRRLRAAHLPRASAAADRIRHLLPRRPVAADIAADSRTYSRHVDMLSTYRQPIGTAMELLRYRDWLTANRYLARPGSYTFAWIQASSRPVQTGRGVVDAGPSPTQLRLLAYASLAAGSRALAFWADQSLGQSDQGRQRLLEMGLLNLEMELLGRYLARATAVDNLPAALAGLQQPADLQSILIRSTRAIILLPVWYGPGAQYVPGQLARGNLELVVPGVPETAQPWLVTPCEVQMLKRSRVGGGTRIRIPAFDTTAIVLLTSDPQQVRRMQRAVARTQQWAARWSLQLADARLKSVERVTAELAALGKSQPDGSRLLAAARQRLAAARSALDQARYADCYRQSREAMQALRILQRAHWQQAVAGLTTPQASPYTVALNTLPEHWRMMLALTGARFGQNLLPSGLFDFQDGNALSSAGWHMLPDQAGQLELGASLAAVQDQEHGRALHLQVHPAAGASPTALFQTTGPAVLTPDIPVNAGDLLRIDFRLRIPAALQGTLDGVVIYDSIAGPDLAVRQTGPVEWKQFTLYRPVRQTGTVHLTIEVGGVGHVYLDDLQVSRLVPQSAAHQSPAAADRRR